MRKSKKVNIFGLDFELFERNAGDVLALSEYYQKHSDSFTELEMTVQILSDSLKHNLDSLKFWQRWKLRSKFDAVYIIDHLTVNEIAQYVKIVMELEGHDTNKKKDDQAETSGETSPKA